MLFTAGVAICLFKKKKTYKKASDLRQTIAVRADTGCTEAASSVNPGHRRPSTKAQTALHVPRLAGWILCANQKTGMAKWKMERRQPVSRLLKLTRVNGLLAQELF